MTEAPRRRWIAIVLIAVAVAAVAFAIGRFSTFAASGPALPTTDSAEAGFARDMQVHHAQAIDMAMTIYRKTEDEDIRALSYDIATGQSAQRGEMYDWLVKWGLPQAGGPAMAWMSESEAGHDHGVSSAEPLTAEQEREAMGMASADELTALADAEGTAADCLFLELMIRHHEGAIPMAEAVLELGSEPRTLAVAKSMRNGQQFEIDAMTSMHQRLSCPA
ncbi:MULTISPECIES: DUF305 domain-containing protein [unclassified Microbacterium]|uniref:DUF305 domain-containing protein n=1 Tax=unclassified Microbacterium TaxID=2609290 RepID=UPI00214BF302|nr:MULTISPECIES: DUF305 domain-containing protein [unclassified Microbacterium]MCR2783832.1 DUF305 domain-containing protein [Microbacterium sp. zg.B96]MDL5351376.1 DUF305 domain-containing protein [Microbacterium sp. zg-YB36]WIM15319.1 DUF305 domain-containing protein [Microbacterium sp. zg-B96]